MAPLSSCVCSTPSDIPLGASYSPNEGHLPGCICCSRQLSSTRLLARILHHCASLHSMKFTAFRPQSVRAALPRLTSHHHFIAFHCRATAELQDLSAHHQSGGVSALQALSPLKWCTAHMHACALACFCESLHVCVCAPVCAHTMQDVCNGDACVMCSGKKS